MEKEVLVTHYTKDDLYTMMYWMERRGAAICRIRGLLCRTLDGFFQEASAALRFPDYFGWNWDAFDECMTDLDWLLFSEIDIVIDDFKKVFDAALNKDDQKSLLYKHLQIIVEYWNEQGIPICVYLNDLDEKHKMS